MESLWRTPRRVWRRLYTLSYASLKGTKLGKHARIIPGAILSREHGGAIHVGEKSVIHRGAMLLAYGGSIRIGRKCSVNPYSVLYGHGGLEIGDYVRIAAHCVIVPANHGFFMDAGPMVEQPMTRRGIRIGSDVWIGTGVRILDGAIIGDGCVVAAGSVVKGTLEPYGIYGGVPARLIRHRASSFDQQINGISRKESHAQASRLAAAS